MILWKKEWLIVSSTGSQQEMDMVLVTTQESFLLCVFEVLF